MGGRQEQFGLAFREVLESELGSRYAEFSFAGHGGMGAVFRARHRMMQSDVAVKVLLPGASTDRFIREARILAQIRSPNVVIVHDCELLKVGVPVLIMEWVDGRTLREAMLDRGGRIAESEAVKWMWDVCGGMSTAAKAGIVHRDLKPSNIMIDRSSTARVMDFGLARDFRPMETSSLSTDVLGTPYYMSPEQAEHPLSVDTRSDIYSLGATFYHALTGKPMFEGDSAFAILFKHKTQPVIPPRSRDPRISNRLSEIIERCVAKSPSDRFQDFDEVSDSLKPPSTLEASPWHSVGDPDLAEHLQTFEARRSTYLATGSGIAFDDVYRFDSNRKLRIFSGDIRKCKVEAIVSSDDELLSMSGGVSRAILSMAGPQIQEEARRFVPVRQGRAVVTSAGHLPQRFVFHGVTMDYTYEKVLLPSRDVIAEIIESCYYHAETLNVTTIAFPLLGTGAGGFSRNVCLGTMFRVLARMLLRRPSCVREVNIVVRTHNDSD